MLLNCGVGKDSWESLGLQGDPISPSYRKSELNIHWKDWCWSWNSNTLATWCEELTHLKRPWIGEILWARGEVDNRGWDGWMASPTQWRWVWVNSRGWWWAGILASSNQCGCKGLDRTERLNWTNWSEMSFINVAQKEISCCPYYKTGNWFLCCQDIMLLGRHKIWFLIWT